MRYIIILLLLPVFSQAQLRGAAATRINGVSVQSGTDIGVSGASTTTFVNLASDFSSTSATLAPVTGWNFAVTSGKTYRIEIIANYQTAATTTGCSLGVYLSGGGVGTIRGFMEGGLSSSAAATELGIPIRVCTTAGATGGGLTTTAVSAINTPTKLYMLVTFTCTTSGTFNVGFATEIGASAAQINANSSLIYQVLN